MRATARIGAFRNQTESMFLDTFTAYSPADLAVVSGFEDPDYADEGDSPGKIAGSSMQTRDTATRTVTVGNMELLVVEGGLHIPISAPVPVAGEYGTGWEYVLTTPGAATDPALTNSRWLVVSAPAKSYATARRLDVVRLI